MGGWAPIGPYPPPAAVSGVDQPPEPAGPGGGAVTAGMAGIVGCAYGYGDCCCGPWLYGFGCGAGTPG
ncbi:hypothetical protein GCM10010246_22480 [Streptomyces cuspidosporus]|uniref:Uncharacterized protein n=1 Tax=Streptomyces cuspidosporus TaxID=66882 RepID=A0ABP5SSC7_9ACTN